MNFQTNKAIYIFFKTLKWRKVDGDLHKLFPLICIVKDTKKRRQETPMQWIGHEVDKKGAKCQQDSVEHKIFNLTAALFSNSKRWL